MSVNYVACSMSEAVQGIIALGKEVSYVLCGEPGIGKTQTLEAIAKAYPDHKPIYLFAPDLDPSDISMKIPNRDTKSMEQFIDDKFPSDNGPVIVQIDEYGKGSRMTRNVLGRMLHERSVAGRKLHPDSIVYCCTNNASDGLGDILQGHEGNRATIVNVCKPDWKEWLMWATDNGVNKMVRAFVGIEKQCLNSYHDEGQENNPYIFKPSSSEVSFVSPRSLYYAGKILDKRNHMTDNFLSASLAGTIGKSAAAMLMSLVRLNSEVKTTAEVIKDPDNAALPVNISAAILMMFNAVEDIETQDDLTRFMRYLERMGNSELEACFFINAVQSKRTAKLARGNDKIRKWSVDNVQLFV